MQTQVNDEKKFSESDTFTPVCVTDADLEVELKTARSIKNPS